MKYPVYGALVVCMGLCVAQPAFAQKPTSGKVSSGDAGYTIGCSAALSLGIDACGELPGRKDTDSKRESADKPPSTATTTDKADSDRNSQSSTKTTTTKATPTATTSPKANTAGSGVAR